MNTTDNIKASLFASAVRPKLWHEFIESLRDTSVKYEVVFCGNASLGDMANFMREKNTLYIQTANIKPAQCYELARRECRGEVVVWVADDCEFVNNIIGKAYDYWKQQDNKKLVLSLQTSESGYNCPKGKLFNMKHHTFYGYRADTPLMAPLGMMSREYLEELGGIDRRYVSGQYENDIVMRVLADGGEVQIFGDKDQYIDIDHLGKSIKIGESTDQDSFRDRPFAKGYAKDREVLEKSWTPLKKNPTTLRFERHDQFEPFIINDTIRSISQSNKGIWK